VEREGKKRWGVIDEGVKYMIKSLSKKKGGKP